MNHSQAIVEALVAKCADHWLIHPSLILEHGRACREAAWSRFAIVRVLTAKGWTKREIAEALKRESSPDNPHGPDRTRWVRQVLRSRYDNAEVRLLEEILRDSLEVPTRGTRRQLQEAGV